MTKKFTLSILALIACKTIFAQFECNTPRYQSEVFTAVTKTADIVYGSNPNGDASLKLDFYEPTGDVLPKRPLIILAHGGSFYLGTKNDADIVTLCNRFAKMGYATASINYTLGFDAFPPNAGSAERTVYRTVHEMKAAIRYFRKDAATTNTYRIDPSMIIVGGSSAGAFIALHTAYLDQISELPASIDTTGKNGLEGICGNPGYNSIPQIVINLCGAIGDSAWMKNNNQPVVSMHGTNDNVVPYGSAIISLSGIQLMPVDGSASLDEQAGKLGLIHDLKTWYNQGHVPYAGSAAYMDSTVTFVKDFLYNTLCSMTLGNTESKVSDFNFDVFPNPADNSVNIKIPASAKATHYQIIDLAGKVVMSSTFKNSEETIYLNTKDIKSGLYSITVFTTNGKSSKKLSILH